MTPDAPLQPPPPVVVAVVGEAPEAVRALGAAGVHVRGAEADGPARIVVVAGPVEGRAAAVRAAVAAGQHAFVAWPPGALAEAEALVRDAEEAGVEVGVERPLALPDAGAGAPARLVAVTLCVPGTAWPRALAAALDVACRHAGSREAARLDAEAERDGAALRAIAVSVRFRTGAFAQVLVHTADAAADAGADAAAATVFAAGVATVLGPTAALADEALAFVHAIAARQPPPFSLDDALATMRLAERVMSALR